MFAFPIITYAQTANISGVVSDKTGETVIGAIVVVAGTTMGTVTDVDGSYTLNVSPGTYQLDYSIVGYKKTSQTVTVTAGQKATVNVTLEEDVLLLEEAVVIGYGTRQIKDLTGAVSSISVKDFNMGNVVTPEQLITGKMAGVQITSNSGAPGSGSRIRIRGGTSLNASNEPLIVIDGVPIDNTSVSGAANALNLLNPNDIENITVLKDASASAIYGSRAANGVIIITTKKGVADNKLHISLNTNNSISQLTNYIDVLAADEFRTLVMENGTEKQQAALGEANTDWQKEIYRTGLATDNNLTFSGGIAQLPYRLNFEYLLDQGILDRSELSRQGISLNLLPSFLDNHLNIDANAKFYHTDNFFADQGAIGAAVTFDPTQPVTVDDDTTYGGYFQWVDASNNLINLAPKNPVGLLNQKDDESQVNRMIGNIKLDYKFHFLPDLHGVVNLGGDLTRSSGTVVIPEEAASSFNASTGGGTNNHYKQSKNNRLLEAYLNYVKELKNVSSKIELTAGHSYQNWLTKTPSFPNIDYSGDTITPAGIDFETENTLLSFFGRLNYQLKEKYMVTGTLRYDGSSRFSPDNRWGLFPSVAVAWRISEENFLHDAGIYLKLRAGYGVTGQQDILGNDYPYIANYDSSTSTAQYQFGDAFYYLLRPDGYDPNIKWEETRSYNAGLDFGFAKDKISGSIDIYKKVTDDLLATIPVPAGTNFTNQILTNVGSMENTGVEANINAVVISTKNTWLEFGINGTANANEITKLTKVEDTTSVGIQVGGISGGIGNTIQIQSVGYPTFTYFAYQQEYDEGGNPIEGEYADQNGDNIINADDLIWGENPTPDFYMGFNGNFRYKKWTAGFSMRGEFGNYIYNNVNSTRGVFQNIPTTGTYLQNLVADYNESNFQTFQFLSDYYIEEASFLRMDYISLGYDFGKIINNRAALALTATVQNVFVITPYSGLDPEIAGGIDNTIYPRPRIYSLNLNLNL